MSSMKVGAGVILKVDVIKLILINLLEKTWIENIKSGANLPCYLNGVIKQIIRLLNL